MLTADPIAGQPSGGRPSDYGASDYLVHLAKSRPRHAIAVGGIYDAFLIVQRWGLPLVAIALTLSLLIWPLLGEKRASFVLQIDQMATSPDRLRIDDPQFRGTDANDRLFKINAHSAVQRADDENYVALRDLAAEMTVKSGSVIVTTAEDGVYRPNMGRVDIAGRSVTTSSDGYSLEGRDPVVDLTQREVRSSQPVTAQGPLGRFSAANFTLRPVDNVLILTGRVIAHLRPNTTPPALQDTPDAAPEPQADVERSHGGAP